MGAYDEGANPAIDIQAFVRRDYGPRSDQARKVDNFMADVGRYVAESQQAIKERDAEIQRLTLSYEDEIRQLRGSIATMQAHVTSAHENVMEALDGVQAVCHVQPGVTVFAGVL